MERSHPRPGQPRAIYQQLAAMQKFSMAIRLVEGHEDPAEQKIARDLIIKELLARANDVEVKVADRPALGAGPVT